MLEFVGISLSIEVSVSSSECFTAGLLLCLVTALMTRRHDHLESRFGSFPFGYSYIALSTMTSSNLENLLFYNYLAILKYCKSL